MKLEFSRQIFEKYVGINFKEYLVSQNRVLCGQTDIHDEANSRFSYFFGTHLKTSQSVLYRETDAVFFFS